MTEETSCLEWKGYCKMSYDWDCMPPRHSEAKNQPTLFTQSPDEFFTSMGVSIDEINLWRSKGWLSFDPDTVKKYDEAERIEVKFIKALARFGLSDAMVNRLLSGLDKPYCYDPETTLYSFMHESWATLPSEPDSEDMVSEGIEELIENEEWDELRSLMDRISEAIEQSESEDEGKNE